MTGSLWTAYSELRNSLESELVHTDGKIQGKTLAILEKYNNNEYVDELLKEREILEHRYKCTAHRLYLLNVIIGING